MIRRAALATAVWLAFAAPALAAETAQEKANIANVIAFYNAALNDKDYAKAEPYLGDRYVQHNPVAADGKAGFKAFIQFLRANAPNSKSEIKRAFADGDYVILHVHSVRMPGTRGNAIFDLFKLENGKVVEHWDAVQPLPETAANTNTMF
jgi:predicted SnoaL-like aldol condensation-catalyzing enzyme